MNEDFFADYKDFIVSSIPSPVVDEDVFCPQHYVSHYIVTLSLFDPLIPMWKDAKRYEVDVTSSLKKVFAEFNRIHKQIYYLTLLEIEQDCSYCVVALSCNNKMGNREASYCISNILDTMILTPLYIGHHWFRLVGTKGRIQRKLFSFSYKEYLPTTNKHNTETTCNLILYPTSHIQSMEG